MVRLLIINILKSYQKIFTGMLLNLVNFCLDRLCEDIFLRYITPLLAYPIFPASLIMIVLHIIFRRYMLSIWELSSNIWLCTPTSSTKLWRKLHRYVLWNLDLHVYSAINYALWAGEIFSVPNLLWHRNSGFTVSSEESPSNRFIQQANGKQRSVLYPYIYGVSMKRIKGINTYETISIYNISKYKNYMQCSLYWFFTSCMIYDL